MGLGGFYGGAAWFDGANRRGAPTSRLKTVHIKAFMKKSKDGKKGGPASIRGPLLSHQFRIGMDINIRDPNDVVTV